MNLLSLLHENYCQNNSAARKLLLKQIRRDPHLLNSSLLENTDFRHGSSENFLDARHGVKLQL
jgi:hypothetical protein